MIQLSIAKILTAIVRNQGHKLLGGIRRGGHRTSSWTVEQRKVHGESIFTTIASYLPDCNGKIGLEVGPGDNLEVCKLFLDSGAIRMLAVEKYAFPLPYDDRTIVLRKEIERIQIDKEVDFAYSNDAFEHISDVPLAMQAVYCSLRPGGRFVCNVDLRGHNVFNCPQRPLDFLSCPDWLWRLMFSHIATTNRVRVHNLVRAATNAGFSVLSADSLAKADADYLRQVRPHLLPRYRELPDQELEIVQFLLALERRK